MNEPLLSFVPKYITKKAIIVYFVVLSICFAIFPNKLPFIWITFGIIEVVSFFFFLNVMSRRWAGISTLTFKKRLFVNALWIRIIYVIVIYLFYIYMNNMPFEFDAGDSLWYHSEGKYIKELLQLGDFKTIPGEFKSGVSDTGFIFWLSFIYMFSFNSILVARIVNALVSSWMCVLIYKLTQRGFGEKAARIAGIMAMLLPTFIYYTGLHLKETSMVFILVFFAERGDFMLRSQVRRPWLLVQVVLLGVSLFFFRTVMAVSAWFALASALLFIPNKIVDINRRLTFIIWLGIATAFVFSGQILSEVSAYAQDRLTNQKSQMDNFATRKGANKLAKYGSTAVFIPLMIPAPFPTMVNIDIQRNSMMINGNVFTRNIYAFFVFVALWAMYKRKLVQQNTLILTLIASYFLILAMSGFALSERFHLPLLPFLLILAGFGVNSLDKKNIRFYVPYLILISIIIIGWNWFKLAGRGIV